MGQIIVLVMMSIALLLPGIVQAQEAETTLKEQVVLKESGRIFVNGKPSSKPELEFLEDKYVFRYKVIDTDQELPPYEATIDLVLPEKLAATTLKPQILAVHGIAQADHQIVNRATIRFTASGIEPGATLTILVDLPRDAFHFTWWGTVLSTIQTMPPAGLIALGTVGPLISILYTIWIFATRAGDVFLRPTGGLINKLPTNLPPAMVGTLVNGYVSMREIAATIIDLARRGYIDIINRDGSDFAFSKKRDWSSDKTLQEYERLFLEQLFTEGFLSESGDIDKRLNKTVWSDHITKGIESLYGQMVGLGYLKEDPRKSHMKIRFVGMLLFFISVVGLLFTLYFFEHRPVLALPWLVSMVSTPILLHLALLVPNRTKEGRAHAARWLAFRQYIGSGQALSTASSTDAIREYEQNLPYAIALSVEAAWTQRYATLPCQIPTWFYSQRSVIDSYVALAQSLFAIIGFIGSKFSGSRNPTAI